MKRENVRKTIVRETREIWSSGFHLSPWRRELQPPHPPLTPFTGRQICTQINKHYASISQLCMTLWISISTLHVLNELVTGRVNKQRNNYVATIAASNLHGLCWQDDSQNTCRLILKRRGDAGFGTRTFYFRTIHILQPPSPWNTALTENLTVAQLVKKFPVFHATLTQVPALRQMNPINTPHSI
jgi:hypothetical protein